MPMTAMSVLIKLIVKLLFLVSGIRTLHWHSSEQKAFHYDLNTFGPGLPTLFQK